MGGHVGCEKIDEALLLFAGVGALTSSLVLNFVSQVATFCANAHPCAAATLSALSSSASNMAALSFVACPIVVAQLWTSELFRGAMGLGLLVSVVFPLGTAAFCSTISVCLEACGGTTTTKTRRVGV